MFTTINTSSESPALLRSRNRTRRKIVISYLSIPNISFAFEIKSRMSLIPSFFGNNRRSNSIFDPFSLDVWDPFKELQFPSSLSGETSAITNARVDWKETAEAHVFKADLPGMKKEEVKVEIEDDSVLKISGERHVEKEEKQDTWHRVERSSGGFSRKFRLPENVKMDQVKASMENGVLTVTVPKVETNKKKAQVKSIDISG